MGAFGGGGRQQARRGGEQPVEPELEERGGLLRRLREVMAEPISAQDRLASMPGAERYAGGKSEELIRRLRRAQIARQRVQIFKPAVDTRYAEDHIVSHSELRIPSSGQKRTARTIRQ